MGPEGLSLAGERGERLGRKPALMKRRRDERARYAGRSEAIDIRAITHATRSEDAAAAGVFTCPQETGEIGTAIGADAAQAHDDDAIGPQLTAALERGRTEKA